MSERERGLPAATRRSLLGSLAAVGAAAGLGPAAGASTQAADGGWNQHQGDAANTGALPETPGPTGGVAREWSFDTGMLPVETAVAHGGTLYCGYDRGVYAVAPDDGAVQWEYSAGHSTSGPTAHGDALLLAADERVVALDAGDGSRRWSYDLGGAFTVAAPTVHDGVAYAASPGGTVAALDPESGDEQWAVEPDAEDGFWDAPSVAGDAVYVVDSGPFSDRAGVRALAAADGSGRWDREFDEAVQSPPMVADGVLAVPGAEHVFGLDPADGTELWSVEISSGLLYGSLVWVDGGTVYAGTAEGVLAIDPDGGDQLWHYESRGSLFPVVDGEDCYAVDPRGEVVAIDPADGTERWTVEVDGGVTSLPAVADGTVYVGSDNASGIVIGDDPPAPKALYALDAERGDEAWTVGAGGAVGGAPVVGDGAVVVGAGDERLYALESDGDTRWSVQVGTDSFSSGAVSSVPAVADGTVYAAANDDVLYAVDAADGTEAWTYEGSGFRSTDAVAVDGDAVYLPEYEAVRALDAADGTARWHAEFEADPTEAPAVAGGRVYIETGATVHALDADAGSEAWSVDLPDSVSTAPTVDGDAVYVGHRDDAVVALSTADGSERWATDVGATPRSIAVARDRVYLVNADGVRALDAADGTERWATEVPDGLPLGADLVLAGAALYVVGTNSVAAFDARDGSQVWIHEFDDRVGVTPAVDEGVLYVGTEAGRVYALSGDAVLDFGGDGGVGGGDGETNDDGTDDGEAGANGRDDGADGGGDTDSARGDDTDAASGDGDDGSPGPGAAAALASLVGAAYVLRRGDGGSA